MMLTAEVILCPKGHKLRVPSDKGSLMVTCPICKQYFEWSPLIPDASDQELKSTLDSLFHETLNYRSSSQYRKLLEFIHRFPAHAPYNCFLLHMQRPGVCYVAN